MKKLTRSRDEKWLGGVCGGIASYTGIDVNLIRLLLAIGTIIGFGSLIVAYIVAWILIPARPHQPMWAQASDATATESETAPQSG